MTPRDTDSIDVLDLSPRVYNALWRNEARTVGALLALRSDDVLRMRNVGSGTLRDLEARLAAHGLELGSREAPSPPARQGGAPINMFGYELMLARLVAQFRPRRPDLSAEVIRQTAAAVILADQADKLADLVGLSRADLIRRMDERPDPPPTTIPDPFLRAFDGPDR